MLMMKLWQLYYPPCSRFQIGYTDKAIYKKLALTYKKNSSDTIGAAFKRFPEENLIG